MNSPSYFLEICLAGFGGIVVFFGIVGEVLAEKIEVKAANQVRRSHLLKSWGEIAVLAGIAFEVVAAIGAASHAWKFEQEVRRENEDLELKRLPRVAQYNWREFRNALKQTNGIKVELLYANQDEESYNLALQIKSCLNEEGWIGIGPIPVIASNDNPILINDVKSLVKATNGLGEMGIAPSINNAGARFGEWGILVKDPSVIDVVTNSSGKAEWVKSADVILMDAIVKAHYGVKRGTIMWAWEPKFEAQLPHKFLILIIGTKDADLFLERHKPK